MLRRAIFGARKFSRNTNEIDKQLGPTMNDLSSAHSYIKKNVKRFDWPTFQISFFQPENIKNDFLALYWFNKELSRIVDVTREPSLGIGKLHFWRDSIGKIYKDEVTKEPIAIALHDAVKRSPISKELLFRVIDTKMNDLENIEISTYKDLENRAEKLRTTMILAHMKMLKLDMKSDPVLIQTAEYAGRCLGVLDVIRNVPHDLSKYRLRLPYDICEKHLVNIKNLWERVDGTPKDELYDVILEVAALARENLFCAMDLAPHLPKNSHLALLHLVEAEHFLERLEAKNFHIFDPEFHKRSYFTVPMRTMKSAKNQTYFVGSMGYPEDI